MTKIKICGLSREQDIDYVNEALPDYIGFMFAKSRRQITQEKAVLLKKRLDSRIKTVGVFVNADINDMINIAQSGLIDFIQLHGSESIECAEKLKNSGFKVIKAISMHSGVESELAEWERSSVDFLLLDNGSGGTGRGFDHNLIGTRKKPYFLAGGLSPQNIEQAINNAHPYAVDLSSGVETDGVKDRIKIIEAVRRARQ